jgi:hypothetical protein
MPAACALYRHGSELKIPRGEVTMFVLSTHLTRFLWWTMAPLLVVLVRWPLMGVTRPEDVYRRKKEGIRKRTETRRKTPKRSTDSHAEKN